MDLVEIAHAHLGRAAYHTHDNPYLRSLMSETLSTKQRAALVAVAEGTLTPGDWLDTALGTRLVRAIGVGTVPRDLQLVLRGGEERVGVESVHAFARAPLFWWIVSHLWCLEAGRRLDRHLGDRVFGYRLSQGFLDAPEASAQMFGSASAAYRRWRKSTAAMSTAYVNQVLATSTLDLQSFYYSVTAPPSAIVDAFFSGLPRKPALSRQARVLTELLDAFHRGYAREISRVDPRPDAATKGDLPLPVGLPSSQILANMVVAVSLRDLDALRDVVGVSAYADDLLVVSPEIRNVAEGLPEYFTRIGVLERDDDRLRLASPTGQDLATLFVSTAKSGMSYSRVQATDGESTDSVEEQPLQPEEIDPYITGQASPDWGGRLRTVLHSPFKRDRVPREIVRELDLITDEIRVGVESDAAQAKLDPLITSLNQGDFLALRPHWPTLIACSWYAGGGDAIDALNRTLDASIGTLESPPAAGEALKVAISAGLRDAWMQALTEALSLLGIEELTLMSRPDPSLVERATGRRLDKITVRARYLRRVCFIDERFISVPLAEFSAWSGPLFGGRAFREFLRSADAADVRPVPNLDQAKRFVPLHEICLAEHLWVAPEVKNWLSRVFGSLRRQPLIDPAMVRDLRRRATGIVSVGPNRDERAADLSDYSLRIAIPSIEVVGERQLDAVMADDHGVLSDLARNARERVARVVNSAARRQADLLVLPEWAVVRTQLIWLFGRSARRQMAVVAGEAPSVNGGVYSNRVWTGLPLVDAAGHRACIVPPPREKCYLSPAERSAVQRAGVKPSTSRQATKSYAWRGIAIASLICFEFADVGIRERLRSTVDLMTVSSVNADWRYFAAAQEATTRDNYCLSLCVNTSNFPGTTLMRPTQSEMAVAATVHGSSEPAVITRDVDMLPIVASRTLGRRPSDIEGLPEPADGLQLDHYKAVPPTFETGGS